MPSAMSINQLSWAAPHGDRRAKEDEMKAKGSRDENILQIFNGRTA